MADQPMTDPIELWEADLRATVVQPLPESVVANSVAAAVAASPVVGATAAAVGISGVAKTIAAIALTVTLGGAVGAVAGVLPAPIQNWVADVVDAIGIELPRVDVVTPTLPNEVELPLETPITTIPGVSVPPVITLP